MIFKKQKELEILNKDNKNEDINYSQLKGKIENLLLNLAKKYSKIEYKNYLITEINILLKYLENEKKTNNKLIKFDELINQLGNLKIVIDVCNNDEEIEKSIYDTFNYISKNILNN